MRRFIISLCFLALLLCGARAQQLPVQLLLLNSGCPQSIAGLCPTVDFNPAAGYAWAKGQGNVPFSALATNTNSTGGYCTDSSGVLHLIAANTLRICTGTGLLLEQASTNTALWSRDMTNAVWTKLNMTASLNAVGADGAANAATTLTATAGSATILQALTIGSTTETYSVYLKRISGTGTINISENGGTNWTACTVNSTSFTRCFVEATLANPSVGIQIVTNGDVIVADFNQNEALTFVTSPIPTTTVAVARSADALSAAGTLLSLLTTNEASAYYSTGILPASGFFGITFNGTSNFLFRAASSSVVTSRGTGVDSSGTFGSGGWTSTTTKAASSWGVGGTAVVGNDGAVGSQTSGAFNPATPILFANVNGYIPRMAFWNYRLSNTNLQAMTR